MTHFLRWYWKPFLIGVAFIAAAVYTPESWLDALPGIPEKDPGDLRLAFGLFGAFTILIDPAFLAARPIWDSFGRPAWDRIQRHLAGR